LPTEGSSVVLQRNGFKGTGRFAPEAVQNTPARNGFFDKTVSKKPTTMKRRPAGGPGFPPQAKKQKHDRARLPFEWIVTCQLPIGQRFGLWQGKALCPMGLNTYLNCRLIVAFMLCIEENLSLAFTPLSYFYLEFAAISHDLQNIT
jgi:hypothetical protein